MMTPTETLTDAARDWRYQCRPVQSEINAWHPRSRLKPSQWAEQNRVLAPALSARPGPWNNAITPYLVEIMDAAAHPDIQKIVVMKCTQIGFSECTRNIIGYWIDCDPGPLLMVMPDEKSAKEIIDERIKPLLEHSPALKRHMTSRAWDVKLSSIKLDSMPIYTGWSGSPQSLATRPCRYVDLDEVDKYARYSGREADPISLAMERTATFGMRRKIMMGSSPTTRDGPIYQAFMACADRRTYHVPCPHCGEYQPLTFDRVKWPKDLVGDDRAKAEQIKNQSSAWYECRVCSGKIYHQQKQGMLISGVWVSDGQRVDKARNLIGQRPTSTDVAFHITALYSPWRSWSECAAMFLTCKDDAPSLQNFRNSWLAEPFEIQVSRPTRDSVKDKLLPENVGQAGVVPEWASVVYATADVQADHFWYAIRAWGYGFRSQLVHSGMCFNFNELYRVCIESVFPIAGHVGATLSSPVLVIDSGHRTDEVYVFAHQYAPRVIPIKGASSHMDRPWRSSYLTPRPDGQRVELRLIDTIYYKDMLARLIGDTDQKRWQLNNLTPEDYQRQLGSEHKIIDRKTGRASWEPITSGAANHAWDLEVYQCACADWGNIGIIPPAPQVHANQAAVAQARTAEERRRGDDFNVHAEIAQRSRSGWLDG